MGVSSANLSKLSVSSQTPTPSPPIPIATTMAAHDQVQMPLTVIIFVPRIIYILIHLILTSLMA